MRVKLPGTWSSVLLLSVASLGAASASAETPLIKAVRNSDAAALRALLQKRVDVNAPEPDGTTALHWAVSRNDVEGTKLLIKAGAKVTTANRYGVTPLLQACETAGVPVVEALLSAGADANGTLPEGETALMIAARTGKADVVKALAARGAKVDAKENWHGQTAMMWAASEDHGEVVKALVELGADFKARTAGGFTPLLFAVREGKLNATRALLELGADVNDELRPAAPPARSGQIATSGNNAGNPLRPSGNGEGTSALILAITNKQYEVAKFLVEHGADTNGKSVGWTALHELAYIRKPNVGKGLPPQEDVDHMDTLELARILLDHGANVNARQTKERRDGARNDMNRVGATPLLLAAKHADVPFMRFLAAHGADPRIATTDNDSVLMAAAGVGIFNTGESAGTNEEAFEATKVAHELGSTNVNDANYKGWTALHGAAKRGSPQIAQFLSDHGADFDVYTYEEGWTPLRIADGIFIGATVKRSDETAELLRKVMKEHGLEPPEKIANDVADPYGRSRPEVEAAAKSGAGRAGGAEPGKK
jgi:ankyrin repeat protein